MMKHWWDGSRQHAAEKTLTSRINVPYRPYLSALKLFHCALVKLQLFQCFHSFSHTACKWKVHTQVVKVKQFWSVSRGLALPNLPAHSKVKSIHSSFAAGWHQVSYLGWVCVCCVCVSTTEVILTLSCLNPVCMWERERERAGSVSGVRFAFASGLSGGGHWEKVHLVYLTHSLFPSPAPGSIHTAAFFFLFFFFGWFSFVLFSHLNLCQMGRGQRKLPHSCPETPFSFPTGCYGGSHNLLLCHSLACSRFHSHSLCLFTFRSSAHTPTRAAPHTHPPPPSLSHSLPSQSTLPYSPRNMQLWIAKQVEKWDILQHGRLIRNIYSSHPGRSFQTRRDAEGRESARERDRQKERGKINVNLKIRKALIFH